MFKFYDISTKTFNFLLDLNTKICETAYLTLIGLSQVQHQQRIPHQWTTIKNLILKGFNADNIDMVNIQRDAKSPKGDIFIAFIKKFVADYCDHSPCCGMDKSKILPFENVRAFYLEYEASSHYDDVDYDDIASERTFFVYIRPWEIL